MKKSKRTTAVNKRHPKAPKRATYLALAGASNGPSDDEIVSGARIVDYDDPFATVALRSVAGALHFVTPDSKAHVVLWPNGVAAIVVGDLSSKRSRAHLLIEGYWSAYEPAVNRLHDFHFDHNPTGLMGV